MLSCIQVWWDYIYNNVTGYGTRTVRSPESDNLSKDLKARGFSFVGSTICYAMMQAVGLVNDHTTNCFRHKELLEINDKWVYLSC